MPLSRIFSATFQGIEAILVEVEADLSHHHTTSIRIVGLPDTAVKESKDRVVHAIKNSGFSIETICCTIHLAPAEIKKAGAFYDLAIALGILKGIGAFRSDQLDQYLVGGELGLGGEVRPIFGALSLSLLAKKLGKKGVLVPAENAHEAAAVPDVKVIPLSTLKEGVSFFKEGNIQPLLPNKRPFSPQKARIDMSEVKGHAHAKRALEIAATGNHNLLMCGPPGTGKTMLARAFLGILPELTLEEALEVTNIHSLAGMAQGLILDRPFRAPHHTISFAGMVGGGSHPKPGEVSLAHKGVLFLDELPEFSRATLEVLRQPLEDKMVTVSRAAGKITFPTDMICIGAMNPCPCGFLGHPEKPCLDSQLQIDRYRRKISGPLLDRIDMHLDIPPLKYQEMFGSHPEEKSEQICERVKEGQKRLKNIKSHSLNAACKALLKEAIDVMGISARSHNRLIKVACTIAALTASDTIEEEHLLEALSYKS